MSSRGHRWCSRSGALSALTLLIVYGNVAALNAQFAANIPAVPALPVIDLLVDPFFLFGMFNGYERKAGELVIQGFRAGRWHTLPASELLPGPEVEYPIWAQAHRTLGELLPERVVLAERARFLARMRARHNRSHPEQQVSRVRVAMLLWPKSRQGREALRVPGREELALQLRRPRWTLCARSGTLRRSRFLLACTHDRAPAVLSLSRRSLVEAHLRRLA